MTINSSIFSNYYKSLVDFLDEQIKTIDSASSFTYYSDIHSPGDSPKGLVFPTEYVDQTPNCHQTKPLPFEVNYGIRLMISGSDEATIATAQDWAYWLQCLLIQIKEDGIMYIENGEPTNRTNLFLGLKIVKNSMRFSQNSAGGLTVMVEYLVAYSEF